MAKILTSKRKEKREMKRHLSLHVGSRWYRAPEICLIENHYDQSNDLWSAGCIIYELLFYYQLLNKSKSKITKKQIESRYLFPGASCFPLSPCNMEQSKRKTSGKWFCSHRGWGCGSRAPGTWGSCQRESIWRGWTSHCECGRQESHP